MQGKHLHTCIPLPSITLEPRFTSKYSAPDSQKLQNTSGPHSTNLKNLGLIFLSPETRKNNPKIEILSISYLFIH